MKRIAWNEQQPGHFEVDLVHHCGPSASGEYIHTIQMIGVATGWSERIAVLGRSCLVMEDGFRRILACPGTPQAREGIAEISLEPLLLSAFPSPYGIL